MSTTYARSTYQSIVDDVLDEINEKDKVTELAFESIKKFILDACVKIANLVAVKEQKQLVLIDGQEDYEFSDSTTPTGTGTVNCTANAVVGVTSAGTGTITTVGTAVTGVGTSFISQLVVGKGIIVSSEVHTVLSIQSDTACTLEDAFATDITTASSFTISSTKFTYELSTGSTITVGGQSQVIDTVTDSYNATVVAPFSPNLTGQTFTIDNVVTEIPTRFDRLYYIDRLEGGYRREVEIVPLEKLLNIRKKDGTWNAYTNFDIPFVAAIWRHANGRKYLKFYPISTTTKEITLYSYVKINPSTYSADISTSSIPLYEDYEPMIREYVKGKIYRWIKNYEQEALAMQSFYQVLREFQHNIPNSTLMTVDYR